jgi:uncharacterized protein DUF5670
MLMSIFVVSLVLWFLGIVTESTFGGLIHVLLLVAAVTAGIGIIQRRKRLTAAKISARVPNRLKIRSS